MAAERMGSLYSISPTNNNTYMRLSPERYTVDPQGKPATINGSFDWISDQIQQELRGRVTPAGQPASIWSEPVAPAPPIRYRLVPYTGTEQAVARREPPVYLLSYEAKPGEWTVSPTYFRPDLDKAFEAERLRLRGDRTTALEVREDVRKRAKDLNDRLSELNPPREP